MNEKRRKRAVSVPPKVIWAGRIKVLAILMSFGLLGAAGFFLFKYKPPASSDSAVPPAVHASGTLH